MTPLSQHEKTQLRLLEQQLQADDPKFVKAMRSRRSVPIWHRPKTMNILFPAIGGFISLAILIAAIAMQNIFVGQLGSVVLIITVIKSYQINQNLYSTGLASVPRAKPEKSFMKNLELRWKAKFEAQWDEWKRNG